MLNPSQADYQTFNPDLFKPVELSSELKAYYVCRKAVILKVASDLVIFAGYYGCAWPYLFIEGVTKYQYIIGVIFFGISPLLLFGFMFYGYIKSIGCCLKLSSEVIKYESRKSSYSISVSDIKKIERMTMSVYHVFLKEKGRKPTIISLELFYKKKEACELIEQLRKHVDKITSRDKKFIYKLRLWRFEETLGKCFFPVFNTFVTILLLYCSYSCIDYDFFRKDYTACYNALGADPNQSENAWDYYVEAAKNYVELDDELQDLIGEQIKSDEFTLSNEQKEGLRKWYDENMSSWASLKKATSVNYCNATYESISILDKLAGTDFSSPGTGGYGKIKNLYINVNACRLAGISDIRGIDLFEMQLMSSRHFIKGKSFVDQLVGYSFFVTSTRRFAKHDKYKIEDLNKARSILKETFPSGIPSIDFEGEVFIWCRTVEGLINFKKIPVQTPLNPAFIIYGSVSGAEKQVRKSFEYALNQAQKGIKTKIEFFSISNPNIFRNMVLKILAESIHDVYLFNRKLETQLSATYLFLDLDEYKLRKGNYPIKISELGDESFNYKLLGDPDYDDKIIYRNDGGRAVLYSIGENGVDNRGYSDDKDADGQCDDIIYWERDLKK